MSLTDISENKIENPDIECNEYEFYLKSNDELNDERRNSSYKLSKSDVNKSIITNFN